MFVLPFENETFCVDLGWCSNTAFYRPTSFGPSKIWMFVIRAHTVQHFLVDKTQFLLVGCTLWLQLSDKKQQQLYLPYNLRLSLGTDRFHNNSITRFNVTHSRHHRGHVWRGVMLTCHFLRLSQLFTFLVSEIAKWCWRHSWVTSRSCDAWFTFSVQTRRSFLDCVTLHWDCWWGRACYTSEHSSGCILE